MDYNQFLKPWRNAQPNKTAGQGYIERPHAVENIIWQTLTTETTLYENELADALIRGFDSSTEEIAPLVDYLTGDLCSR